MAEQSHSNSTATKFRQNGHSSDMSGFIERGEQTSDTNGRVAREYSKVVVCDFVSIIPFQRRRYVLFINKNTLTYLPDMTWCKLPAVFSEPWCHGLHLFEINRPLVIQSAQQTEQGLIVGKHCQRVHVYFCTGAQQWRQRAGITREQVLLAIHEQCGFVVKLMVGET